MARPAPRGGALPWISSCHTVVAVMKNREVPRFGHLLTTYSNGPIWGISLPEGSPPSHSACPIDIDRRLPTTWPRTIRLSSSATYLVPSTLSTRTYIYPSCYVSRGTRGHQGASITRESNNIEADLQVRGDTAIPPEKSLVQTYIKIQGKGDKRRRRTRKKRHWRNTHHSRYFEYVEHRIGHGDRQP